MPKKILIVEDNPLNMKLMADILESQKYSVSKAVDGEEALEAIAGEDFDMVLLDLQLPKKSGYQVLKEMKKKPPTIVVSACCMEDEIGRAKAKGCLDFITKPINVGEFLSKINSYLKED